MPGRRRRRRIDPGTIYHFIARFVAGEFFVRGDHERRVYLALLGRAIVKTDWRCFSYAIMSNHIHLALLAGTATFCDWIRDVHSPFGEWINEREDRIGSVFTRGPKTIPVQPDGAASLISYIHCNPVRASVARTPAETNWTSHQQYLGVSKAPVSWLDVELGLSLADMDNGQMLDRWIVDTKIGRDELDQYVVDKARRGRPSKSLRDSALVDRNGVPVYDWLADDDDVALAVV